MSSFRTERYAALNKCRWDHFTGMGIPLFGKTVFEPGAGIGDQTEWLLDRGVKTICVLEGRQDNLDIIQERFGYNARASFMLGDMEACLPELVLKVDFIFCYGVYYHLNESFPEFHILRGLAAIGDAIALDYLVGDDTHTDYGYDNPSTSLSQKAFRPRTETLLAAMKDIWGYAYTPKEPLQWIDPVATENRQIAVASHTPLDNENLVLQ